jgi:tetratricopeptide (TPR) repeat protein
LRERLALAAAAVVAFGGALRASFHFDDYSIFSAPPAGPATLTRPLTFLTFRLNEAIGGRDPFGYHLFNLALHIGVVLLLFDVLRRIVPHRAAFIGALIFAIHPIQSEPVAYIFARAILLAALFCLLSLRAWLDGRRWLAVAWFSVALLGKEEAAAFPLALLLFERGKVRGKLAPLAAMAALSLAAGLHVIRAAGALAGSGAGAASGISPVRYLAAQGIAILRYLRLVVVPWGFTVDPEIREGVGAWFAWAAIAALAVVALRKGGKAGGALLAALVLLTPSSSIFPAADLAADRRMYLPMLAIGAALGILLARLRDRWVAAIAAVLIALSIGRMEVWRTERSLWREAVERAPAKVRPKIQLARASDPPRALELLEQARALAPEDPLVPAEIGRIYLGTGRPEDALREFGRALALAPRDPQALNNRGAALLALGLADAARLDFERALEADPCMFEARLNLRRPPAPGCGYTREQLRALTAR